MVAATSLSFYCSHFEWREISHADVSWPPQNWLDFSHHLLIFLILASFWLKQAKFATSGHFLEKTREEWPELWHADVFSPPSELIIFWPWSVNFPHFGIILTWWNRLNLGFLAIFFRMHERNGLKFDMQMYPDCIFNCLHFDHGLLIFLILTVFWLSETSQICSLGHFLENAFEELAELILSYPKKWKRQLSAY